MSALIHEILSCQKLVSLNLSDNQLTDNCADNIVTILSKVKKREIELKELNLNGNALSNQFIKNIFHQLIQNENLKSLALKNNNIEITGIQELLKVLSKNNYILSLDLRNNPGFTKKASLIVLEKLKSNLNKFKLSNAVKKSALKEYEKDDNDIKSDKLIHVNTNNRSKSPSRNKMKYEDRRIKLENIGMIQEDQPDQNKEVKFDEKGVFSMHNVKRSNSFANDNHLKCHNCESMRNKMLRFEFENKKLRIKLNELQGKNPNILNSCKLIRFYN